MYPVSAKFTAALQKSHRIKTTAEVHNANGRLMTLDVDGGSIDVDRAAAYRRRVSLTARYPVVDPSRPIGIQQIGAGPEAAISVYGNEVKVSRGIIFDDGTEELIPLGIFGISEVRIDDKPDGISLQISGFDRGRKVARRKLTSPYIVASGTNYATAIQTLLTNRVAGLYYSFATTTHTTPLIVLETGTDPWEAARRWADAIGYDLHFDAGGVCVLRVTPDPETAPVVATYAEGSTATFLNIGVGRTNEGASNHWIVTGESTETNPPVRAESKDDDSASLTYYLGSYGDVPEFVTSELVKTTAQAQALADSLKKTHLGIIETIGFDAIVNPAHDAGDVVQITRDRIGIGARYTLDAISVPLSVDGALAATTRRRKQ